MKTLLILFAAVMVCGLAFAQGDPELTKNKNMQVDGFAPVTATKYTAATGGFKFNIPVATKVMKWCLSPTVAAQIRYNAAGDPKPIAANGELCRTVRKGVTQIQYSSASGSAVFEQMY